MLDYEIGQHYSVIM